MKIVGLTGLRAKRGLWCTALVLALVQRAIGASVLVTIFALITAVVPVFVPVVVASAPVTATTRATEAGGAEAEATQAESTPAESTSADPGWIPVSGLPYSMTLMLLVERSGVVMDDPLDKLAVFAGSAVRGVASPTAVADAWVYFVTAAGNNNGESLSFQFYDASADEVIVMCEGLLFESDATRGSVQQPYVLHEDGMSAPDCALSWAVPDGFQQRMQVYVSVFFSGVRSLDPDDRVVAFVRGANGGSEVRGVGQPFTAGGEQVFAVETWGASNGEQIRFRLYRQLTGLTVEALQSATFYAGAPLGSASLPFRLDADAALPVEFVSARAVTVDDSALLSWEVGGETGRVVGFEVESRRLSTYDDELGPTQNWTLVANAAPTAGRLYRVRIDGLLPGRHQLRISVLHDDGARAYSDVVSVDIETQSRLVLSAPYPNPAATQALVHLAQSVEGPVEVALYDVSGRRVRTLFDSGLPADATVPLLIDTRGLANGRFTIVARSTTVVRSRTLVVVGS